MFFQIKNRLGDINHSPSLFSQSSYLLFAIFAGRVVTIINRRFQVGLRVILPELGDRRISLYNRILVLVIGLIDPADINILNIMSILVELQGSSGRVRNFDCTERLHQFFLILHISVNNLNGPRNPIRTRVVARHPYGCFSLQ